MTDFVVTEFADRSAMVRSGMPDGWGPGPWEFSDLSWTDKSVQFGNLRPWQPEVGSYRSGPVLAADVRPPSGGRIQVRSGRHYKAHADTLKASCWCGRSLLTVDAGLIRSCLTERCRSWRCVPPKDTQRRVA